MNNLTLLSHRFSQPIDGFAPQPFFTFPSIGSVQPLNTYSQIKQMMLENQIRYLELQSKLLDLQLLEVNQNFYASRNVIDLTKKPDSVDIDDSVSKPLKNTSKIETLFDNRTPDDLVSKTLMNSTEIDTLFDEMDANRTPFEKETPKKKRNYEPVLKNNTNVSYTQFQRVNKKRTRAFVEKITVSSKDQVPFESSIKRIKSHASVAMEPPIPLDTMTNTNKCPCWSKPELEHLTKAVASIGCNWELISRDFFNGNRSPFACWMKWKLFIKGENDILSSHTCVNTTLKQTPWSVCEKITLIKTCAMWGCSDSVFSELAHGDLSSRSAIAIKHKYFYSKEKLNSFD